MRIFVTTGIFTNDNFRQYNPARKKMILEWWQNTDTQITEPSNYGFISYRKNNSEEKKIMQEILRTEQNNTKGEY